MRNSRRPFTWLLILLTILVAAALLYGRFPGSTTQSVDSGALAKAVHEYQVDPSASGAISSSQEAEISGDGSTVTWYRNGSSTELSTTVGSSQEVVQEFDAADYFNFKNDTSSGSSILLNLILPNLLIFAIMGLFLWWFLRQTQSGNNQAMSFGRSRARLIAGDKPSVTFMDVAGVDEAKTELGEIVEFLKYPTLHRGRCAHPQGRAAGRPAGDRQDPPLQGGGGRGEGALPQHLRLGVRGDVRRRGRQPGARPLRPGQKNSPCIVFVDEIDAVGRQRGAGLGGGHDEREQSR